MNNEGGQAMSEKWNGKCFTECPEPDPEEGTYVGLLVSECIYLNTLVNERDAEIKRLKKELANEKVANWIADNVMDELTAELTHLKAGERELLEEFVEWVATTEFAGDWKDWAKNFLASRNQKEGEKG
jgi:hypothetical protein